MLPWASLWCPRLRQTAVGRRCQSFHPTVPYMSPWFEVPKCHAKNLGICHGGGNNSVPDKATEWRQLLLVTYLADSSPELDRRQLHILHVCGSISEPGRMSTSVHTRLFWLNLREGSPDFKVSSATISSHLCSSKCSRSVSCCPQTVCIVSL